MPTKVEIYSIGTPVIYRDQMAEICSSVTIEQYMGTETETDKKGNTRIAHVWKFVTKYDIILCRGEVVTGFKRGINHEELKEA